MSWAIEKKGYSQRRACGLIGLEPKTYRYASTRPDDAGIRSRLRVLAGERRRFGHRRLHILLRREGIGLNHKKLFRLYREERLTVRRRWPQASSRDTSPDDAATGAEPALVAGLRIGRAGGRPAIPSAGRGRRLHPRVAGARCRHLALGPTGRSRARSDHRVSRSSAHDRQRQRYRADIARGPILAGGSRDRMALYCSREAATERLRREPERPLPGRVPQRAPLPRLASVRRIVEAWRIDYNLHRPRTSLGGLTPNEFAGCRRGKCLSTWSGTAVARPRGHLGLAAVEFGRGFPHIPGAGATRI